MPAVANVMVRLAFKKANAVVAFASMMSDIVVGFTLMATDIMDICRICSTRSTTHVGCVESQWKVLEHP